MDGGNLFPSLLSVGAKMQPMATKFASKVSPSLAAGALSSLDNFGMNKILGQGVNNTGGVLIPRDKIAQLIAYKHPLSAKQKQDILNALQTGNGVVSEPTRTQIGGFLCTLLASIGIPFQC